MSPVSRRDNEDSEFVQDHTNMFYRNAVNKRLRRCSFGGGRLNKGAFIDGFYLLGGRSFQGAFIQSITVIRTCFGF